MVLLTQELMVLKKKITDTQVLSLKMLMRFYLKLLIQIKKQE